MHVHWWWRWQQKLCQIITPMFTLMNLSVEQFHFFCMKLIQLNTLVFTNQLTKHCIYRKLLVNNSILFTSSQYVLPYISIYTNSMETYISITNCVFSYIGDDEVLRLSHSIISNNEKRIIAMWTNYLQFIVTVYVKSVEQFNSSEKWF